MRRLLVIVTLLCACASGLQGCATSWQTFLAGTLAGTVVGVSGLVCTVACR